MSDGDRASAGEEFRIGIALSGGGTRATGFSIGALLALVETGLGPNIRLISSVSGGSIAAAMVSTNADLGSCPHEFRDDLAVIMKRLCSHGAGFWDAFGGFAGVWYALLTLVLPWAGFAIATIQLTTGWGPRIAWATVGLASVLIISMSLRGVVQRRYLCWLLHGSPFKRYPLKTAGAGIVDFVFCATDLATGCGVSLWPDGIHSQRHGWADPKRISLVKAVYASSAYPLVLPPIRIRNKMLEWSNGAGGKLPKHLVLGDGGISNNLATVWFESSSIRNSFFGAQPSPSPSPSPSDVPDLNYVIMVNSSAAPKVSRVRLSSRILRPAWQLRRLIDILYANTVHPRQQSVRHSGRIADDDVSVVEISIADTIAQTATRILSKEPLFAWDAADLDYMGRLRDNCITIPTTLRPLRKAEALAVVQHGYNSMLVALASIDAIELIQFKRESHFASLVHY